MILKMVILMKYLLLKSDGFFSFSIYIILIYLISLYYQYYNEMMITLDIRMNFIEIYHHKIRGLVE